MQHLLDPAAVPFPAAIDRAADTVRGLLSSVNVSRDVFTDAQLRDTLP
jgi:hypothetical protein